MRYLHKSEPKVILSSAIQFIVFKIILVLYIMYIPWPQTWWSVIAAELITPILSGYLWCRVVHWDAFRFNKKNIRERYSVYRFIKRISCVCCFLAIGAMLEILRSNYPGLPSSLLLRLGISTDFAAAFLFNFFLYVIAAVFPMIYAVTEYLFVSPCKDSSQ